LQAPALLSSSPSNWCNCWLERTKPKPCQNKCYWLEKSTNTNAHEHVEELNTPTVHTNRVIEQFFLLIKVMSCPNVTACPLSFAACRPLDFFSSSFQGSFFASQDFYSFFLDSFAALEDFYSFEEYLSSP